MYNYLTCQKMSIEQKLVQLNNYLPQHLLFEDANKLLELVTIILQTSFLINNLFDEPQTETVVSNTRLDTINDKPIPLSISILPEDIQFQIIDNTHPYYLTGYCSTDKYFQSLCGSQSYQMLKKWCFPSLTINEIKKILPSPSLQDIITLSLVYSPIPESVKYWDRVTLFYYACEKQYTNPEEYLIFEGETVRNLLYMDIIPWICYKFNRLDILEKANRNEPVSYRVNGEIFKKKPIPTIGQFTYGSLLIALTKHKSGLDVHSLANQNYSDVFDSKFMEFLPRLMNTLMNYEEIIDTILFMRSYTNKTYSSYLILINGYAKQDYISPEKACIIHSAKMIGKERVQQLMTKYNLNDEIRIDYNAYNLEDSLYDIMERLRYLQKSDSVDNISISDNDKAVYYLSSGNFPKYLKYKSLLGNKPFIFDSRYVQLNNFGAISFDSAFYPNIENLEWNNYLDLYEKLNYVFYIR